MNGLNPAGAAESGPTALEVSGLGKRYRRGWALKDCSFRLPAGRICALVGPNGAGKSTLMSIVSGLLTPTEGTAEVLGRPLGDPATRSRIGFVSQDKPMYAGFTVAETLRLGRELNTTWHQAKAEDVVAQGEIPLSARVGSLSGGQRTRVTLALALGRLPELLVLDEPMSDLDPLARHQLMGVLMAEAAERGITVLMSSHVIAELEDSCDYLVLLSGGGVLLAGDIDEIVEGHQLLVGDDGSQAPNPAQVVEMRRAGRQITALVRPDGPAPDGWETGEPTLEEVLLAHLRTPGAPALITAEARPAERTVAA
ncbi:ABC transporter ATP-binding protein [Kitasatospora sp. NPDC088346]|uniref:ABC transporter ATP-binding protein n=1 Tax=Kitasatospora sp. NPDC088346 TaxID=3364073 RepID=UPI0038103F3B